MLEFITEHRAPVLAAGSKLSYHIRQTSNPYIHDAFRPSCRDILIELELGDIAPEFIGFKTFASFGRTNWSQRREV